MERYYIGRRHVADEHGDPVVIDWRAEISTRVLPGHAGPTRWASACAAGSASTAARSPRTRTSTSPTRPRRPAPATSSPSEIERPRERPDARHRRHHPARAGRHRPGRRRPPRSASRARRAPARPRSACTGRRGCSTRFRDRLARAGRARRRAEPRLPRPHRRGAAGARRGRGQPRDDRGPGRDACRSAASTACDDRRAQGRRADGRGAAPGGVVARPRRRPRPLVVPRGARKWRVPAYEVAGDPRRAARARRPLRRRAADAAAAAGPRGAAADGAAPATPPTTGCRTRSPAVGRVRAVRRRRCGRRSTRAPCCSRLLSDPAALARGRRRPARRRTSSGLLLWTTPPQVPRRRPLVGRRRGAARRDRATSSSAPRASATSCSTRRRTSRRCSCGRSGAAARPGRRRCSATSPRAPRRGRPTRGRRRWRHLGKPDGHVEVLDRGFRVPATVIDYAARLLPLDGARARRPGVGAREPGPARHRAGATPAACSTASPSWSRDGARRPGSIGVIVADAHGAARCRRRCPARGSSTACSAPTTGTSSTRSTWCRPRVAKGLEFDRVVVVEPAAIAAAEPDAAHRAAPALRHPHPGRLRAHRRAQRGPAGGAAVLSGRPRRLAR